ncbi:MAG: hypothetical protein B7X06_03625 [Verrucomicrobia bacterium 21-51-4]|nr:MAG: hypothetical protein B7X06_03625 [Verrucomicrobia bacterium 21-51-4]
MELVPSELPIQVFVDYAHSPDPIAKVLQTLRGLTPGQLHIVFGCGGNRDRLKRPMMLSAALKYADYAWVTSDNPRQEAQSQIFEDMRRDVPQADTATFIEDRREAIGRAIAALQPGDTLIIAGKGHEAFQEFADRTVSFSDRVVAHECLAQKHFQPQAQEPHV